MLKKSLVYLAYFYLAHNVALQASQSVPDIESGDYVILADTAQVAHIALNRPLCSAFRGIPEPGNLVHRRSSSDTSVIIHEIEDDEAKSAQEPSCSDCSKTFRKIIDALCILFTQ